MEQNNQNEAETSKAAEMALLLAEAGADQDGRCRSDKLDALMYWADSAMHQQGSNSISGATYASRVWGPWPRTATEIETELVGAGAAKMEYDINVVSVTAYMRPLRPANCEIFSPDEAQVLHAIAERHGDQDPDDIGHLARAEPAYRNAGHYGPVEFAKVPDTRMLQKCDRAHRPTPVQTDAQATAEALRAGLEMPVG